MDIVSILLWVLVFVCFVWGGFWIIGKMTLDAPIDKFARIVFGVICLLLLISAMTGYLPLASFNLRR